MGLAMSSQRLDEQQAEAAKLDAATSLRRAKRLPVRRQRSGRQVAANLKGLGYGG
jgi:hypothetical protein